MEVSSKSSVPQILVLGRLHLTVAPFPSAFCWALLPPCFHTALCPQLPHGSCDSTWLSAAPLWAVRKLPWRVWAGCQEGVGLRIVVAGP